MLKPTRTPPDPSYVLEDSSQLQSSTRSAYRAASSSNIKNQGPLVLSEPAAFGRNGSFAAPEPLPLPLMPRRRRDDMHNLTHDFDDDDNDDNGREVALLVPVEMQGQGEPGNNPS